MTNRTLRQKLNEIDVLLDWVECAGVSQATLKKASDALSAVFYAIPLNDEQIPLEAVESDQDSI